MLATVASDEPFKETLLQHMYSQHPAWKFRLKPRDTLKANRQFLAALVTGTNVSAKPCAS